jgi:methionyl-tRNA formyltransferase
MSGRKQVVLLCATERGLRVLKALTDCVPGINLTVFCFREESHEPPFFEKIADETRRRNGTLIEARHIGSPSLAQFWKTYHPDLLIAVSWRYYVPPTVFRRAKTAVVFHDSMLPKYRGFSPTVWAMINGEDHTGVTLFHMAQEIDAGDIIDQLPIPIAEVDTISDVMERVTNGYVELLSRNIHAVLSNTARRVAQNPSECSYTCKWLPGDGEIVWSQSSGKIHNLIRAIGSPYPGAFTTLDGRRLIIWSAERVPNAVQYVSRVPGRVVEILPNRGSVVLTGDGQLLVTRVQWENEPPRCGAETLKQMSVTLGR